MLEISKLAKKFGSVKALKEASLRLQEGEMRALLGANGSGKSTLVKILSGLNKKDSGGILLDGKPADISGPMASIRMGISMAYQDLSLIPKLSVMENIVLGNEPLDKAGKINNKKAFAYANDMIGKLEIKARPDTLVSDLDLSNQGLVEVAKALYPKPRILLLDEVTASMHQDQVQVLFALLREYTAKGLAVLFVSHRFDEVYKLCETATILREGISVKDLALAGTDSEELAFYMTGQGSEIPESAPVVSSSGDNAALLKVSSLNVGNMVRDVSMYVSGGEIVGIAGLQGQGQTEFIRALYGAMPGSGSIEFEGREFHAGSPAASIRRGIGFISGDRDKEGVFAIRSVSENILIVQNTMKHFLAPLPRGKQKNSAEKIIQELKVIAAGPDAPANSLSGGNQQKLLIGRWLPLKPRLLLLDDPTKGVDVRARGEINAMLREMTKTGMAVLFSSSDNEELLHIARRIYVFYENRIVAELQGGELNERRLAAAMLGIKQAAA